MALNPLLVDKDVVKLFFVYMKYPTHNSMTEPPGPLIFIKKL